MAILSWNIILAIAFLLLILLTTFIPKIVQVISRDEGRSTTDKVIRNCLMTILGFATFVILLLTIFINI